MYATIAPAVVRLVAPADVQLTVLGHYDIVPGRDSGGRPVYCSSSVLHDTHEYLFFEGGQWFAGGQEDGLLGTVLLDASTALLSVKDAAMHPTEIEGVWRLRNSAGSGWVSSPGVKAVVPTREWLQLEQQHEVAVLAGRGRKMRRFNRTARGGSTTPAARSHTASAPAFTFDSTGSRAFDFGFGISTSTSTSTGSPVVLEEAGTDSNVHSAGLTGESADTLLQSPLSSSWQDKFKNRQLMNRTAPGGSTMPAARGTAARVFQSYQAMGL